VIYRARTPELLAGIHAVVNVYHHTQGKFAKSVSRKHAQKAKYKIQIHVVACVHLRRSAKIMVSLMTIHADVNAQIHGMETNVKNVHQNHATDTAYGIINSAHVYAMHHGCQIHNVKHVGIWNADSMVHLLKKIAHVNAKVTGKAFSATNALPKRSVLLLELIAVYMHGMKKNASVRNNASRWIVKTTVIKIQKHVIVNVIQMAMAQMQVNRVIPSY